MQRVRCDFADHRSIIMSDRLARDALEERISRCKATPVDKHYQNKALSGVRMIRCVAPGTIRNDWDQLRPDHYSYGKAAFVNLSVSLAGALTGTGVTADAISPGAMSTPCVLASAREFWKADGWAETVPITRQRGVSKMSRSSDAL